MILSSKRITKALISLHGCAGWSAPLLFANHRRQVLPGRCPYYVDTCSDRKTSGTIIKLNKISVNFININVNKMAVVYGVTTASSLPNSVNRSYSKLFLMKYLQNPHL